MVEEDTDCRHYNIPTTHEVAAIIPGGEEDIGRRTFRDIVLTYAGPETGNV
jgi:hypothetical protein